MATKVGRGDGRREKASCEGNQCHGTGQGKEMLQAALLPGGLLHCGWNPVALGAGSSLQAID